MKKECSKCHRILDRSEFNWKIKGIKLSYHCKECSRMYVNEHYRKNTTYYINKARARNVWVKKKSIEYISSYLRKHWCVDCSEKDILVLEFDHRDRSKKDRDIGKLIKGRSSVSAVISEISKCDVRCANCHRRKTARETNSWRLKYAV